MDMIVREEGWSVRKDAEAGWGGDEAMGRQAETEEVWRKVSQEGIDNNKHRVRRCEVLT